MAITISKATNEIVSLLKKQVHPNDKKKTYWSLMSEQLTEEGTWDSNLINQIKEIIIEWVNKLKKSDLMDLWEDSETAAENYSGNNEPDNGVMVEELSEELLDLTLNRIEDSVPREEYYIPEAKNPDKNFSDDDDFADAIDDDIFEDDDLDDFEDNYFDDDDRY
ncbi:hypothetical protein ASZ90_003563 [hydrocarbon metagenome]|uniref:Uncharacterized protein n=1 Tax=hydrocarbon metagenome TaxID=938273 RepID=A0A0W8G0C0_9ZZZZ